MILTQTKRGFGGLIRPAPVSIPKEDVARDLEVGGPNSDDVIGAVSY